MSDPFYHNYDWGMEAAMSSDYDFIRYLTLDGVVVAAVRHRIDQTQEEALAIASRIHACLVACNGIDTGYLQHFGATTFNDFKRVKDQRDELLHALDLMMIEHCPLTGNPTHADLVAHWEYEKSQGRGCADDMLFVLSVIASVKGEVS